MHGMNRVSIQLKMEKLLRGSWFAIAFTFTSGSNISYRYYEDKLFSPISRYVVYFLKFFSHLHMLLR